MSVSSCLTAYKKSFITNNKLKFPNGLYFEDNLFFTKAITKATRLGIIQDKLYFRRIHNDSITQNLNYHFQDLIKINDLTLEYLHTLNIKDKIRRQSINFRCNLILTRFEQLNKQEQQIIDLVYQAQQKKKNQREHMRFFSSVSFFADASFVSSVSSFFSFQL